MEKLTPLSLSFRVRVRDLIPWQWMVNGLLSSQDKEKKSARLQKIISRREKATKAASNFHVKAMEFENLSFTPRSNGLLKAIVKYNPVAKNFEKGSDGKIVLRRVSCDITDVSFKYWKFPTLPIPLKRSGGYLDFLYLDNDIRVTRGNRGGLFIHFRPAFLEKLTGQ